MAEELLQKRSGSEDKEIYEAFLVWEELCKLQARRRHQDFRLSCRIVYINLDRDTHRRENFERCAQDARVKNYRMPGIDGSAHTFTEAEIALLQKKGFSMARMQGCRCLWSFAPARLGSFSVYRR